MGFYNCIVRIKAILNLYDEFVLLANSDSTIDPNKLRYIYLSTLTMSGKYSMEDKRFYDNDEYIFFNMLINKKGCFAKDLIAFKKEVNGYFNIMGKTPMIRDLLVRFNDMSEGVLEHLQQLEIDLRNKHDSLYSYYSNLEVDQDENFVLQYEKKDFEKSAQNLNRDMYDDFDKAYDPYNEFLKTRMPYKPQRSLKKVIDGINGGRRNRNRSVRKQNNKRRTSWKRPPQITIR